MSDAHIFSNPFLRKSFQFKTRAALIAALAGGNFLQIYSADGASSPIFFHGAFWSENIGNAVTLYGNSGTLQITTSYSTDGGFNAMERDVALIPNWFDLQLVFSNTLPATIPNYFSLVVYYYLLNYSNVAP